MSNQQPLEDLAHTSAVAGVASTVFVCEVEDGRVLATLLNGQNATGRAVAATQHSSGSKMQIFRISAVMISALGAWTREDQLPNRRTPPKPSWKGLAPFGAHGAIFFFHKFADNLQSRL